MHNKSIVRHGETTFVQTPSDQWAYAAEYRMPSFDEDWASHIRIDATLRVSEGAIGVGCLSVSDQYLCETTLTEGASVETATLAVTSGETIKSIMFRNVAAEAKSSFEIISILVRAVKRTEPTAAQFTIDGNALQDFLRHAPGGPNHF